MKESIVKEYYIPRLELKDFISCCIPCVIANRKVDKKKGELIPLPKSSRLLSVYHIDHVGSMTVTHKAYQHILVVIDCFSKINLAVSNKTICAKE